MTPRKPKLAAGGIVPATEPVLIGNESGCELFIPLGMPLSYIVLSDNFAGGEKGSTISIVSLLGCNIPALIEAGHITATPSAATSATNTKEQ